MLDDAVDSVSVRLRLIANRAVPAPDVTCMLDRLEEKPAIMFPDEASK